MNSNYELRRAHLTEHRQDILAVWDRNGVNQPNSSRHLEWAYENNPFGQGPIFLLVHCPSQRVVGSSGLILRRMKFEDSILVVGRAAGFAVDRDHRTLGPALLLSKAILNDIAGSFVDLVYTLAPKQAIPVCKRLQYLDFGTTICRRRIISVSNMVDRRLPRVPGILRKTISRMADFGIEIATGDALRRSGDATIRRIQDFDERFDDLWHRSACNYAFATERSSEFLRWRFSNNPKPQRFVCDALCDDSGRILGYTVYYVDEIGCAHVIDLFAENQEDALVALLSGLVRRWRLDGVKSATISCFGNDHFISLLGRMGFMSWGAPVPTPYELFVSAGPASSLPAPQVVLDYGFLMVDDFQDHL